MIRKIIKTIEKHKMLELGEHVIVGLSGGADSVALLYALLELELRLKITAVHINHGIRGLEADEDEKFAILLCESLNIPVEIYRCNIIEEAKRLKITEEEAGRNFRYAAFERAALGVGAHKIAVAHNMNDNAETIIMRLCRGTGLKGLCGIPAKRGKIIRPLIEISREEIEQYCAAKELSFCTDSTNLTSVYTRNKIRLELLPFLQDNFNSEIVFGISKMSALLNEENEFIESVAGQAYEASLAFENENELAMHIDKLNLHPTAIKRRVIRKAYEHFSSADLALVHVEDILSLFYKESGKIINLPHHICATREYELLLIHKKISKENGFCYNITLDEVVFIKELNACVVATLKKPIKNLNNIYTKIFCYDKMKGVMQVRSRLPGDKIFVKSMGGSKKIKDYFSDTKLPARKRDRIPLLTAGADIIWIMDEKGIVSDLYKSKLDSVDFENKLFVTLEFL